MKKKILIVLSIVFAISIIYSMPIGQASAEENIVSEETKSNCAATLDYDFADNRVIVVLNQVATLEFKTYTPMDFPEANCLQVKDLNEYTSELVQHKLMSQKTSLKLQTKEEINNSINVDDFRTVLTLELAENSKENVLETIKKLEQRDDVLSVEPDYRMTYFAAPTPTPTYYSQQWAIDKLKLEQAWDITTGNSSVVVGVMDSGIDGNHLDLKDRIATGLCGNFTTGSVAVTNPTDQVGHGTWVAGVIGAQRNSGTPGITGVAQNIKLASLQISNPDEGDNGANVSAYVSSALRAIEFAKQKKIPIINLSSGYDAPRGTSSQNSSLETAIKNYPGLFVCAAGNGTNNNGIGKSNDVSAIYPANFNLPNLISVGASNANDTLRTDSNFGATTVDLFAPGQNIRTTALGGGHTYQNQTSMATPHVSGVAALLLSANPHLTASQLKTAIMAGVDLPGVNGTNPLQGRCVSNGRLNAYKALLSAGPQPLGFTVNSISAGIWPWRSYNISLKNTNAFPVNVTYNDHMCYEDDGKYWQNLDSNHSKTVTISANSSQSVTITENLSAGWITAGIHFTAADGKGYRMISYTDGLTGNSCNPPRYHTVNDPQGGFSIRDLGGNNIEITGVGHPIWGTVLIPDTIDGKTVTSIGNSAFANQTQLSQISIPASVISINWNAFVNTGLWNNTPNNSVVYADKWVVGYKGTLSGSISLLSNTVGIALSAFSHCTELTSITIPSGVSIIGSSAFSVCHSLANIYMPSDLTPSVEWSTAITTLPCAGTGTSEYRKMLYASSTYGLPINYTVTSGSLPAGLSLDSNTGLISGTVSSAAILGTNSFTVTASVKAMINGASVSQSKDFTIDVFYVPPSMQGYDFYNLDNQIGYGSAGGNGALYTFVAVRGTGGYVVLDTWGKFIYYEIYTYDDNDSLVLIDSQFLGAYNTSYYYFEAGKAYLIDIAYIGGYMMNHYPN